jgi:hypothetical protein
MENINSAKAFETWFNALKSVSREEADVLFQKYSELYKAEKQMSAPSKVETRRRANGCAFSVAIHANGTTSDLD